MGSSTDEYLPTVFQLVSVHGQLDATTERTLGLKLGPEAGDPLVEFLNCLPEFGNLMPGRGEGLALCFCLQNQGLCPIAEFTVPGAEPSLLSQVFYQDSC